MYSWSGTYMKFQIQNMKSRHLNIDDTEKKPCLQRSLEPQKLQNQQQWHSPQLQWPVSKEILAPNRT